MVALNIVRRDLLRYLRNPGRTALLFALPLVMSAIFALVFGGSVEDQISIRVLLWDEDDSLITRLIRGAGDSPEADQRLDLVPVGPEGLEQMERGEASALIHLPEGFSRALLDGTPTTVEVVKNPAERFLPNVVEEGVILGAAVLSQGSRVFRPELATLGGFVDDEAFPEDLAVASLSGSINGKLRQSNKYLFPPVVKLETSTATGEAAAEQSSVNSILAIFLPGFSIMGVFFLAQSVTRDILRERESGLLRHMLTSPVTPADYLGGKCLSVLLVSSLGFALLIAVGIIAGVDWGSPAAIVALVLASALAAGGTLLLITSLVGSERQADALSTIVIIVWCMVGGAFVPLEQMPSFLRPISAPTLVYWATDGFATVIREGGGVPDVAVNLTVLAGVGSLLLGIGAWSLGRKIARGVA